MLWNIDPNFRANSGTPRCRIGVNPGTGNEKTIIFRRRCENILNRTDLGVTVVIFPKFYFFLHDSLRILENLIFQLKKVEKLHIGAMSCT